MTPDDFFADSLPPPPARNISDVPPPTAWPQNSHQSLRYVCDDAVINDDVNDDDNVTDNASDSSAQTVIPANAVVMTSSRQNERDLQCSCTDVSGVSASRLGASREGLGATCDGSAVSGDVPGGSVYSFNTGTATGMPCLMNTYMASRCTTFKGSTDN